jgi:uncharacterized protein
MLLGIHNLTDRGASLTYQEKAADFPQLSELIKKGECAFSSPIDIELIVKPVSGMFHVNGSIEAVVSLECSRCLKRFDNLLKEDFFVIYTRELPEVEHSEEDDEVELKAEDMGLILFAGEEIDFREMLQEQLLLALPYRPLCAESCKGICAQCGADLNNETCGCTQSTGDSRFAALKNLKLDRD